MVGAMGYICFRKRVLMRESDMVVLHERRHQEYLESQRKHEDLEDFKEVVAYVATIFDDLEVNYLSPERHEERSG
jgi:hypothetical protein